MTYQSPAIEADVVANARRRGLALFRVIVLNADERYARLCHHQNANRALARGMAIDMARLEGPREAIVEEIDTATGRVASAFKPEV